MRTRTGLLQELSRKARSGSLGLEPTSDDNGPEAIKDAAHAQPFKPFTIHLANGGEARVPAPDFMSFHPKGRLVVVFTEAGGVRHLEMAMITEISFDG